MMNESSQRPDRRQFLSWASASVALAAMQGDRAMGNAEPVAWTEAHAETGPRLTSLELLSSAPLAKMKTFYHQTLGLPILSQSPERLMIGAGETRLTFVPAGKEDGKPFYHFAFNIPENKVLAARAWQLERTPLMFIPERLRDPRFPDDVVDYRHWNAHSLFFFDPAGNVVEYIARHDLRNAAPGPFRSKDILYASEIGLIVDDVLATAESLQAVTGLEPYRGKSEPFTALGDERGLLLVMKRGRHLDFRETGSRKMAGIFRTRASVRGARRTDYPISGFPYELSIEG